WRSSGSGTVPTRPLPFGFPAVTGGLPTLVTTVVPSRTRTVSSNRITTRAGALARTDPSVGVVETILAWAQAAGATAAAAYTAAAAASVRFDRIKVPADPSRLSDRLDA